METWYAIIAAAKKMADLKRDGVHDEFSVAIKEDACVERDVTPPPYQVFADGKQAKVFATANCDFVQLEADAPVEVTVEMPGIQTAAIRPSRLERAFHISETGLSFTAQCGDYLSVELNGNLERPLFVYVDRPIAVPDEAGMQVIKYEGDTVHDIGATKLSDNTIVYLGHNTVVRGKFFADNAQNIKIIGHGVIDATTERTATMFVQCKNIHMDGVCCVGYYGWNNKWFCVDGGSAANFKVMSTGVTSDGIDLLGSSNITLKHLFVRNEDDCVCLKTKKKQTGYSICAGPVENIVVDGCVFWCGERGNGLEIGYENDEFPVRNVVFKNVDVIHRHRAAHTFRRAAISIHCAGSGEVSNITYDNVYVESTRENFIYISHVIAPDWGNSGGVIENITLKNITLAGGSDAPSYIFSDTGGKKLPIRGIVFENLTYKGKAIKSKEDAKACGFVIDDEAEVTFC